LQQTGLKTLVIAGGVGANQRLRTQLQQLANQLNIQVFYPRPIFCTDNGAMIAYTGYVRLKAGFQEPLSFNVQPRWSMENLS
jgi:N6-L-threonylcarbamoyladenine synthase